MTEFWNEQLTAASWEKLQEMAKKYDFVLIGGWAAFLWTGMHRSKDIDIVVGYKALERLRQDYALTKNDRLKKYEAKLDKFDIDIYVPFYSVLSLPLESLESTRIQGITTVTAEGLLVLKQGAEIDRRGSVKGRKDAIDIVTLLVHGGVDLEKYAGLVEEHGLEYKKELERVVKKFDVKDLKFLGMNLKQFRDWQKTVLGQLKPL